MIIEGVDQYASGCKKTHKGMHTHKEWLQLQVGLATRVNCEIGNRVTTEGMLVPRWVPLLLWKDYQQQQSWAAQNAADTCPACRWCFQDLDKLSKAWSTVELLRGQFYAFSGAAQQHCNIPLWNKCHKSRQAENWSHNGKGWWLQPISPDGCPPVLKRLLVVHDSERSQTVRVWASVWRLLQ